MVGTWKWFINYNEVKLTYFHRTNNYLELEVAGFRKTYIHVIHVSKLYLI